MNKGHLSLSGDTVHLTTVQGTVWLSQYEIASLLRVFVSKVQANIRSVFKERLLWPEEVCYTHHYDGGSVELYNLELITLLAFRFDSREAAVFRKWVMGKLTTRAPRPELVMCACTGTLPS